MYHIPWKGHHGSRSHEIARLGLTRTFQVYAASGDLTVKENVMVGCFMRTRSRSRASSQADDILKAFQISRLANNLLNELPIAAQKRVVMATAIGTHPKTLLLDEVAAGLVPQEVEEIWLSYPVYQHGHGHHGDSYRTHDGNGDKTLPARHRARLRPENCRRRTGECPGDTGCHQGLPWRKIRP